VFFVGGGGGGCCRLVVWLCPDVLPLTFGWSTPTTHTPTHPSDGLLQEERQRLYSEMEDVVAGLNARFVELVREEKQLLNEQLEESARLHAHTLAYLQVPCLCLAFPCVPRAGGERPACMRWCARARLILCCCVVCRVCRVCVRGRRWWTTPNTGSGT
jgi:hypothetical protein